jgi:hypothetical protein
VDAGVDERLLHSIAIDDDGRVCGVLLDDREQVAEQPPLFRRQLRAVDGGVIVGMLDPSDRRTRRDERRGARVLGAPVLALLGAGRGPIAAARGRALQALGRRFALLRYLRPSSYRAMYAL